MRHAVTATIAALAVVVTTVPGTAWAQNRPAERGTLMARPGASIGVSIRDVVTADLAATKLSKPDGVFVEAVQPGTPAEKAGLKNGDVVLEFDGEHVRGARHFARLVQETPPGRSVSIVYTRGGSRQSLNVVPAEGQAFGGFDLEGLGDRIEERLRSLQLPPELGGRGGERRLGVSLVPLSDQLAGYFGVTAGVLVSEVLADSPASRANIKPGDVITAVNGQRVSTPADVAARLRTADTGATTDITLTRDKREMHVQARLLDPRRRPSGDAIGI